MKVLLDTCVWGPAQMELRSRGHDVVWAGEWAADPGDEEMLTRAFAEQRVLVTLDKDFGELAIVRKVPHHGIAHKPEVYGLRQGNPGTLCAKSEP